MLRASSHVARLIALAVIVTSLHVVSAAERELVDPKEHESPHVAGGDADPRLFLSDAGLRFPPGARIEASDGAAGLSVFGDHAIAGHGGRGGDIFIRAPYVIADKVVFAPGDGGPGGHAVAHGKPDAVAIGGNGGNAGRLIIDAAMVLGRWTLEPANGGRGGDAAAMGQNPVCDSNEGSEVANDSRVAPTYGDGQGRPAEARAIPGGCGMPGEPGGDGGNAIAYGGHGGLSSQGDGGDGGKAMAIAGQGGDGGAKCYESPRQAIKERQNGGNGGRGGGYIAHGGNGGDGAHRGGNGGDAEAFSRGGRGGNASYYATPGTGGGTKLLTNVSEQVRGGDAGSGVLGGSGGSASGQSLGGATGERCGGRTFLDLPFTPLAFVLAAVGLAGLILRRRE